jgi:tetratricopeptide (TPR) repeat protein
MAARGKGRLAKGGAGRALGLLTLLAAMSAAPGAASQPAPPAATAAVPSPAPAASSSAATAPAAGSASAALPGGAPPRARGRKQVAPAPAPTPEQLAALGELEREARTYETAARDYRTAITRIVQHHYEERRQRVLSALNKELTIEEQGLRSARDEAIRRLELFVARYSGPEAHPENTPDAMFRLAALYEERARENPETDEQQARDLMPAIALYKRIIGDFPAYRDRAGVFYYLGHALKDSNRFPESQQVFRSLVCKNKFAYPVPTDPRDPTRDVVAKVTQDNTTDFWTGWENRHPTPLDQVKAAKPTFGKRPVGDELTDDETRYKDPFPKDCAPIAQEARPGEEPRYLAEVWWIIGDYYFNEIDPSAGPYAFNRAESAYHHALEYKKRPVYGVAMYKLAWTHFKQQRYETSIRKFVDLLRLTDQEEKETGDPGADFRNEAYTYIAGSLTYLDFAGPPPEHPYIPRNDVLDLEQDPRVAEQRMRIAIERVQNPDLVPQNEKWTVEVYKALAQEFRDLNQYRNTVEISELILQRWPMHRDAPVVQAQIADIFDTLTAQSREGTAERAQNSAKALEARTKLAAYVGTTPWVEANKDDPEALQAAERLVRGGLRRAAADHTNAGRALAEQAITMGDKESRDALFERSLSEYRLAVQGWSGYLNQDENSPDAYESRFWLADAHHMIVVVTVALDRSPSGTEIDDARRAAVDVRDSNEDDRYLMPAAQFIVDTAYQALLDKNKLWQRSGGTDGIEPREKVKLLTEGDTTTVVKDPLPPQVQDAVAARDEYVQRVPPEADTNKNADLYAFQAAEYQFNYGQFEDARKRYEPIYAEQCGKSEFGYRAWERLTTMSNLSNDVEQSRKLAEAALTKSCAVTAEQKVKEGDIARPTISRGYYIDAAKAFEKAEKMADGPERVKAWREAAALYRVALEKAPARDEAPEAAMNGAYCYKQVGDYDQAIEMYTLFIKEYGNEQNLAKLEKGDAAAQPPKPADPKRYGERVEYLKKAYDTLAAAYVLFFNYRSAAETYDTIARNGRFTPEARRTSARNAVLLYANIGDTDKMLAARTNFLGLKPPAEQKADIDFLVASADLKAWDEKGPDEGANRTARMKALTAMDAYYAANKGNSAANGYVVRAAYQSARLRRAGRDTKAADWCKSTISAFDKYKATEAKALGSEQADMAAECAYVALDEKIRKDFDYETGHHRYDGVITKIKEAYEKDLLKANELHDQLQAIITSYGSLRYTVAARARQGSLYDSCRTGLYNAREPGLKLYTPAEEKTLKLADESGRDDLAEKADAFRQNRREQWRATRDKLLSDADKVMVRRYTEAVLIAKGGNVRNAAVDLAIQRLAFFTDILGNEKLREYTQGIEDRSVSPPRPFEYQDGVFLRSRPGKSSTPEPNGMPAPLPVLPQ